MWTCSKCGAEVEDSFEACWGCGTTSSGEPDPNFQPETEGIITAGDYQHRASERLEEHLVTAATFLSPGEAHVAQNRLQAEGIHAYLADEEAVAMDWMLSNAMGGVKLQVAGTDLERAQGVLAEHAEVEQADES